MADGILTLNAMMPEKDLTGEKMLEPGLGAGIGAGIGLALASYLKSKNKENLPKKIDEEKTPKKEPPEDPDLLPEILNLKDINLDEEKNIKISTEEDFKKLDEELKWFPFSKEDFEGGALDNEFFKNTLNIIKGDIEFTGDKSFDEGAFLLTPPRGQQEIALRFLKQKLINDEADSKFIEHISKLQKNLGNLIEKEGYYGDLEAESTGGSSFFLFSSTFSSKFSLFLLFK